MSAVERERLKIMAGVKEEELTLVAAAELMGVCYRHGKRIWRRYRDDGAAGLVQRLRGQPSARRKPSALRAQVLALCAEARKEGRGRAEGEIEKGGEDSGAEPSVAARWSGSRTEVLEPGQSARTGDAACSAGLRSACVTLRPPYVPHCKPEKTKQQKQTTKGTFFPELYRGTFLKSFDTSKSTGKA